METADPAAAAAACTRCYKRRYSEKTNEKAEATHLRGKKPLQIVSDLGGAGSDTPPAFKNIDELPLSRNIDSARKSRHGGEEER